MPQSPVLPNPIPVMILCGGMGTRLRDVSEVLPKPMVPVGPFPIVWHIMKRYAAFGHYRFILCLGYKRNQFVDFFLNYDAYRCDATMTLGRGRSGVVVHGRPEEDGWEVTLADTGLVTMTGGRVARAARYLRPEDQRFHLTYGDGLSDVDLSALERQHLTGGKAITITAVHPSGRFGELGIDGDQITSFNEKPQTEEGYINGGFMVVERRFVDRYLTTDERLVLEQAPLREAAGSGDISAYRHQGFWQCMDTAREHQLLNDLYAQGRAPWLV
jgi:glucose-1-phosphate cytidylyltransferase